MNRNQRALINALMDVKIELAFSQLAVDEFGKDGRHRKAQLTKKHNALEKRLHMADSDVERLIKWWHRVVG